MKRKRYRGEVKIKFTGAKAIVTPAPVGDYGKDRYFLKFPDGDTTYICTGDDIEPLTDPQRGSIIPELLMLFFVLFAVGTCGIHYAQKSDARVEQWASEQFGGRR